MKKKKKMKMTEIRKKINLEEIFFFTLHHIVSIS